ncbi:MAG: hypothetical protein JXA28_10010 [Bacteroidetes bacterium]|nr:hypothetical protein [Bacteroidota bacterium]
MKDEPVFRNMLAAAAVALIVLLAGCDTTEPCVCTEVFATAGFSVVNAQRLPVEGIDITVRMQRTGEYLDIDQGYTQNGYYVIAHDGVKDKLLSDGDVLEVSGMKDTLRFEEVFVVGVPGRCRCHVEKISGPDTLYLNW